MDEVGTAYRGQETVLTTVSHPWCASPQPNTSVATPVPALAWPVTTSVRA
jgi:hypothetical protein